MRAMPLLVAAAGVMPVAAGLIVLVAAAFGWCPPLGAHDLSLDAFRDLARVPGIWHASLISGLTGLATAGLSLALAALFFAAFHHHRLFGVMHHLISPLLAMPHAALALGLAFVIAPSGLLFRLAAPVAGFDAPPDLLIVHDRHAVSLIAGLVLKEVSFLFLMMLASLPQTGAERYLPVATSLGYGRVTGFLKVVMPLIYPQLRLPVVAVIAYACSAADVALILGPTTPDSLPVVILTLTRDPDLSRQAVASAAAVLQIGVTASAVALWLITERIFAMIVTPLFDNGERLRGEGAISLSARVLLGLTGMMLALIALSLALWTIAPAWRFPALLPEGVTLSHWQGTLAAALHPLLTSVIIGLLASLSGLVLALLKFEGQAEGGRVPALLALVALYIPLAVPQVALMRGMTMLFLALGLDAGLWAVTFSHLVFVLPYVVLSLSGPWRSFDSRYIAVALSLQAPRWRVFLQVRLPMMRAAIATAAAVGFAVSAGQYLPSLMAGGGRVATITTEAVARASGSDRRVAAVYALLQMLLPAAAFLASLMLANPRRRAA